MGKLMKGIRIIGNLSEIIVASSVIVELVEKYGGKKRKKKDAAAKVDTVNVATEN